MRIILRIKRGIIYEIFAFLLLLIYCSQSEACPDYCKLTTIVSAQSSLPQGFFIYAQNDSSGIFCSPLRQFSPRIIKGTASIQGVTCLQISDDGKWLLYKHDKLYVQNLQTGRSWALSVSGPIYGQAGFLRGSPLGTEVYYLTNRFQINAIKMQFTDTNIVFSGERVVYQDTLGSLGFYQGFDFGLAVVKDEIMGTTFYNIANLGYPARIGYITIPDSGKGIATNKDIYHWKNEDTVMLRGCGIAMSHEGYLALSNPMEIGHADCLPQGHRGFCITPFRRINSSPVDIYNDNYLVNGISINWCPEEYRGYYQPKVDFWYWYFGNNMSYVIGRQDGTDTPFKGLWLIEWGTNTWTKLNPDSIKISVASNAVYFSDNYQIATEDSNVVVTPIIIDTSNDVGYKVISPNGGESFKTGDICSVKVTAKKYVDALILLSIDTGKYRWMPTEFNKAINPVEDSLFIFKIPDSVSIYGTSIALNSNCCKIILTDYNQVSGKSDESDSCFSINSSSGASSRKKKPNNNNQASLTSRKYCLINKSVIKSILKQNKTYYTIRGVKIMFNNIKNANQILIESQ
jgi:hypothetical protein